MKYFSQKTRSEAEARPCPSAASAVKGFTIDPGVWAPAKARSMSGDGPPAPSAWGYAFAVPALLLLVLDAAIGFELLSALSLLLLLPGASLLLLGRERTRAIWFPLLFLAFAIPVPLVVAEATIRYHAPARYDDTVRVSTVLTRLGSRGLTFDYVITNADSGQRLASASTTLVALDAAGKAASLPPEIRELLGRSNGR